MDVTGIISTLAWAAQYLDGPSEQVVNLAVRDAYNALKSAILSSLKGGNKEIEVAIDKVEEKPQSEARKAVLIEEAEETHLDQNEDVVAAANELFKLLQVENHSVSQEVSISQKGNNNTAQVAGGNIYNNSTVKKNVQFTPDESHITPAQGRKIQEQIKKLAIKLSDENGEPNFGRAYNRLYRRFEITSYLALKREDFDEAMSYLRQQNRISRSKLRSNNPKTYRNTYIGSIQAKAKSLGWEREHRLAFVAEVLGKSKVRTLTDLGPIQLKKVDEAFDRQIQAAKKKGA